MRNKLIIILTLILIFNFILIPKHKSNASGLSIAAIYGPAIAEKLISFIIACAAAGVTFNALEEAKKMFDKWQMDSNNWEPPSDGGGGNGWKDTLQAVLAGLFGGNAIGNLIDSIKDWFQSLGAREGENSYFEGYIDVLPDDIELLSKSILLNEIGMVHSYYYRGNICVLERLSSSQVRFSLNDDFSSVYTDSSVNWALQYPYVDGSYLGYYRTKTNNYKAKMTNDQEMPEEPESMNYNVSPGSYVLTDIPPSAIPQPDISYLPFEHEITPGGESKIFYPGSMGDLVNDVTNNTSWEDLQNSKGSTYTLTETQTGVEIETGTTEQIPYPNPNETELPTSELEGQRSIIGLLKSIINWISQIPNMIGNLFVPSIPLDLEPIRNINVTDKWPFSIPKDVLHTFQNLSVPGQAPIWELPLPQYDLMESSSEDVITIDFNLFNSIAQLVRTLLTILFLIAICILTWKVFI